MPETDDAVAALLARVRSRQTQVLHVVSMLSFIGYASFWHVAGIDGPARLCLAAAAAILLSLVRSLRWPHAAFTADLVIGITAGSVFVMAVMLWHDVPVIMSWAVFAPVFGWLLGSPLRAVMWAVIVALMIAVGAVLVYDEVPALHPPQLDYRTTVLFSAVHAISMVGIAVAAMWLLQQRHRLYLATLAAQQAELRETNAQLAQTQRYKDRFYAAMSHELRTPMNAIAGIAELLDDDGTSSTERRELATSLRVAATHMSGIVGEMFDLTHLNEHHVNLAVADLDLHEVVASAVATARGRLPDGDQAALVVDLTASPRHLRGDRRRLIQVIGNVIANVVHATPAREIAITVTAGARDDDDALYPVTFRVAASGGRQAQADQAQADQAQADQAQADQIQADQAQADQAQADQADDAALGLGQLISRRLVEHMGGRVTTLTTPGAAGFAIEVPLAAAVVAAVVPFADPDRLRFLVVDDNHLNRLVATKLLSRLVPGAIIDAATDGADAVARVRAVAYHLILMDMEMPTMDGETATRHIRALDDPRRAATPIVAMTANTDSADLQRCLDAGMNQTLAKPVTALALSQIVQAHVGQVVRAPGPAPRVGGP